MDLRLWLLLQLALLSVASGNLVFNVYSKFEGREPSLRDLKAHDVSRHGRSLSVVEFPIAGDSLPYKDGLYFTKIGLGSPRKDYYVKVDTTEDFLWVNCVECSKCPSKSELGLGFDLTLYDPGSSAKAIGCDHDFCTHAYPNKSHVSACKSGFPCSYEIEDGYGSKISGYFVKDNLFLHQTSGYLKLSPMIDTIIFGCRTEGSESGSSLGTLDGTLGLGFANTSIISQLAAAGKTKKMFAHCLDNKKGGGIFTIGEVVKPEIKTIPIIPNLTHYSIVLKNIEVGSEVLRTPTDTFHAGNSMEVIIDSGTTLTYLPDDIYDALTAKVTHNRTRTEYDGTGDSLTCFSPSRRKMFRGLQEFPTVKFNFGKSLTLTLHPTDYLFPLRKKAYCLGWLPGGFKTKKGKSVILLGGLMLTNKLVIYNMEDQTIGWTEFNCSASNATVKDEDGAVHVVKARAVSSADSQNCGLTRTSLLLLILIVMTFNPLY